MKTIRFAVVIALAALLQTAHAAESQASSEDAFDKLSMKIESEKLNQRESDDLGALYAQEKQRQEKNDDSHTEYDFKGWKYHLELRNNTEASLKALRIECRFFYTEERKWRTFKSKGEKEQKYIAHSLKADLPPKEKVNLTTDPFITSSWSLPSGYYYTNGRAENGNVDPDGLWVKVTYITPDGKTLVRDFCNPKPLSSRAEWVNEPEPEKPKKKNKKK